jgi:hypothetical protein
MGWDTHLVLAFCMFGSFSFFRPEYMMLLFREASVSPMQFCFLCSTYHWRYYLILQSISGLKVSSVIAGGMAVLLTGLAVPDMNIEHRFHLHKVSNLRQKIFRKKFHLY